LLTKTTKDADQDVPLVARAREENRAQARRQTLLPSRLHEIVPPLQIEERALGDRQHLREVVPRDRAADEPVVVVGEAAGISPRS